MLSFLTFRLFDVLKPILTLQLKLIALATEEISYTFWMSLKADKKNISDVNQCNMIENDPKYKPLILNMTIPIR